MRLTWVDWPATRRSKPARTLTPAQADPYGPCRTQWLVAADDHPQSDTLLAVLGIKLGADCVLVNMNVWTAKEITVKLVDTFKWRAIEIFYRYWQHDMGSRKAGYSVLVPVPADLPVFLEIALRNIAKQNQENLVEVLVIPDVPSSSFRNIFSVVSETFESSNVRLIEMNSLDRMVGQLANTPSTYHFLQLKNGIEASKATHVLFHDADLFLSPGDFLRQHFMTASDKNLSVLGVNARTGRYTDDCVHLVATWEMLATVEWLMRFQPYLHKAHKYPMLNGELHLFDTTHYPQYLTNSEEVASQVPNYDFVHFNQVITQFRIYCKQKTQFIDDRFKLLLIRLLTDAIRNELDDNERLPKMEELRKALSGHNSRVSYGSCKAIGNYGKFRGKMDRLLELGVLDEFAIGSISANLEDFDRAFGWKDGRNCNPHHS